MNKCFFIGNLTKDPEVSTTGSGISVCKFSIAVNRTFVAQGQERETDFFNIVTWRGLAENCGKFLSKGSKVAVVGRIENRTYEQDGQKRYFTDIIADDVEFLNRVGDSAGATTAGQAASPTAKKTSELKPVQDEELPF